MKQINQYIQESILDDEDDILQNNDWIVEQWLKDNYRIKGKYTIKNNIIDVVGNVLLQNFQEKQLLPKGYRFGTINGDFDCYYCEDLISLKGAPRNVKGNFVCIYCNKLKNLDGAPQEVIGCFTCAECKNLTSLKGCPQIINADFDCSNCEKLKN